MRRKKHNRKSNQMGNSFEEQNLPLGYAEFETIRSDNSIYVDKTELMFQICNVTRQVLLVRPRRFGKTLLVSTFASLFSHGTRDFQGLAIERLWNDKTYPVIRLDFSGFKEFEGQEEFCVALHSNIQSCFAPLGFSYDRQSPVLFWDQFKAWLKKLETRSIVLLIDEYDTPLTKLMHKPELFNRVREELGVFYLAIKQFESRFRFFFMTGIMKFSSTSIFSAFNNIVDISMLPQYGALLGYTESEINHYFGPHIEKASRDLGISKPELLNELKLNYNGFCFEETASQTVYCPWSVLSFFAQPQRGFKNYWSATGGLPTVLMQYLKHHSLRDPADFDTPVPVALEELATPNRTVSDVSLEVMLNQAGYLTIKKALSDSAVLLGYPNREVYNSMGRLYAQQMTAGDVELKRSLLFWEQLLDTKGAEEVVDAFNRAFSRLNYQAYPIKDEATCGSHLVMLLLGALLEPTVEKHNAYGRSDIEVETDKRRWVFELKYAKTETEVLRLLDVAVEQIKSRHYGESLRHKELCRLALVFSESERRFVAWKAV